MELGSPHNLLSGTSILDTLIAFVDDENQGPLGCRRLPMVIEGLIGPSTSGKVFHKLLKALDSRSPCDKEMTKRAARIVLSLAGDIRLKQFPEAMGCISSLLDASQREVNEYKELMLQGLLIIEKLATDEDNCRVMSRINGIISMIMRPLRSDLLNHLNHNECSDVVDASQGLLLCTILY